MDPSLAIFYIFQIAVLIFSVVIHEVSHGAVALMFGDTTARDLKRLSLNPIRHLDPFGSVILPIVLALSTAGRFMVGWAKPVPYNPYNLKNMRWGELLVGLAGPMSNFILAAAFSLILNLMASNNLIHFGYGITAALFLVIIQINLALAFFNLVPIAPLDGSKILYALFPRSDKLRIFLERYGLFLLIFFIVFFANQVLGPAIFYTMKLLHVPEIPAGF